MSKQVLFTRSDSTDETSPRAWRALAPEARAATLVALDWSDASLSPLGQAMAWRDIDLGTALCVFFKGGPERFNYMPKRDVPAKLHQTARLLDNIHQRINSRFYLPHPAQEIACCARLEAWLAYQRSDVAEGRRGRWVFDESALGPLFDSSWCRAPDSIRRRFAATSIWQALMAPLRGLGVDRDILKYKDDNKSNRSDKP